MQNNFMISIKGLQTYSDGCDGTDIELLTEGRFSKEDGVYYLEYDESEITGLGDTSTTVEIGDGYVSLERSGNVSSQMLFMPGRRTSSLYGTKYGELLIDIYTEKLDITLDKHGGRIAVDYILDVNGSASGHNNFEIIIKEDTPYERHHQAHKKSDC